MFRKVAVGVGLLATLALGAACGKASGNNEPECPDLACQCTNSGFEYTGQCVAGAKLCQCPATEPHQLVCNAPSCSAPGAGGTHTGKLYKPVRFCPTSLAGADVFSNLCSSAIAEVTDLRMGGVLSFGSAPSTLFVRGTIVAELSPFCAGSCALASLALNAECKPGEHGVACRCSLPFELSSENAVALDSQVFFIPPQGTAVIANTCSASSDIRGLVLTTDTFTLSLTPTTCDPGRTACDQGKVTTCGPDGEFGPGESCPAHETCLDGRCQASCRGGSIYCDESGERICGATGVKQADDPSQPCAEGVSCVDGQGCLGARRVDLGIKLGGGSLDNVSFVGQVLRAEQDVSLNGYGFDFTMYETSSLGWQVYEGPAATGPFTRLFDGMQSVGPGAGVHEAPELSLPLSKGSYYLLAVKAPPTTIFESGAPGAITRFATPLGVIWSRDGFAGATIPAQSLAVVPAALVGSASLLP